MRTACRLGMVVFLLSAGSTGATPPGIDTLGDPLPPQARGRLGTTRFRSLGEIKAVALSPDGKTLAVAGGDRLMLLSADTGKQLRTVATVAEFGVRMLAFRAGGRQVISAGEKGIHVWDATSGKLVDEWVKGGFDTYNLSFAADGNRFAAGYPNAKEPRPVLVRDLAAKKEVGRVAPLQRRTVWAALSPDGKTLATGGGVVRLNGGAEGGSDVVQVWDVASGKEKRRIRTACDHVLVGRFSPDGKTLATAGHKAAVQLWDTATGKERWRVTLDWFDSWADLLGFSPDGQRLYAANYFDNLGIWETAGGKELTRRSRKLESPVGAGFRPDGTALAWGRRGKLLSVWDPVSGKPITPPSGHRASISTIGFSADGRTLCSLDAEAQLLRWEVSTSRQRSAVNLQGHLRRAYPDWIQGTAAFSADGRRLAVPVCVFGLVVIDTASGRKEKLLEPRTPPYIPQWQVAFSADGARVGGFPGLDHYIQANRVDVPIWDAVTGKEIGGAHADLWTGQVRPWDRQVVGAFSRDGKRAAVVTVVAAGSDTYKAELVGWDLTRKKKLAVCKLPGALRVSVALGADGRTAVVAGEGGKLFVCDVQTGRQLGTIRGDWDSTSAGPLFSPDGRSVAIATIGKRGLAVRLIERATWTERQTWTHAAGPAFTLAFSPDGKTLASGHQDTTILLWDLTGRAGRPGG